MLQQLGHHHLGGDTANFHLGQELVKDGTQQAGTIGSGGVFIKFYLGWHAVGGLGAEHAGAKARGDEDKRGAFIGIHGLAPGNRVSNNLGREQRGQVLRFKNLNEGGGELTLVLVDHLERDIFEGGSPGTGETACEGTHAQG